VTLVDILSALGTGILGTIVGHEYRRRRDATQQKQDQIESWFNESLDIIGRGMFNIERAFLRSEPDYDHILNELGEFSERLYIKSNNPPAGVPESAVATVSTVAELYAKAIAVAEANSEKEGNELLSELFDMAQNEQIEEYDFTEAFETATERSEKFSQLISAANKQGIETDEIAETVQDIVSEWDNEDFVHFISPSNEDSNSVEEYTQFVLTTFFDIARQISGDSYEYLQSEQSRVCS
jgi:hypothetical protein